MLRSLARNSMKVSWSKIVPSPDPKAGIPCARSSHGLSFVGGSSPRLILQGGEAVARTPIDPSAEQSTWSADYSSADNTWKWRSIVPKEGESLPPSRVAHAQAVVNDKVFIFGGRMGIMMDEKALNDMWVLDASGDPGMESWSQVRYEGDTPPPSARSFHKMVAIGTNLYVFGGCGASGRMADLHKFDTSTNKWTDLGSSSVLKGRGAALT
mmetsp:Transcript_10955/g.23708  ORF Transcript_10955/g.23708 Transcript_10955/m.23708 type:complete len:211 (-) Transcript_10955:535-1167(-)